MVILVPDAFSPVEGETLHHDWSDLADHALLAVSCRVAEPPETGIEMDVWSIESIVSCSQAAKRNIVIKSRKSGNSRFMVSQLLSVVTLKTGNCKNESVGQLIFPGGLGSGLPRGRIG